MASGFQVCFVMNRATNKILYMEAGKDFVDVLLAFLQLPLASILKLLSTSTHEEELGLGNASRIYESVCKMSQSNMVVNKASLTNPPCALNMYLHRSSPLRSLLPEHPAQLKVYKCSTSTCLENFYSGYSCKSCNFPAMGTRVVEPISTDGGYVKPCLSFIITDDLSILHNSATEIFNVLHMSATHAMISMPDLHSFDCSVTTDEALEMLKYFFSSSRSCLTIFLAQRFLLKPSKLKATHETKCPLLS